ncbi:MAG: hypothetical protein R3F29_09725 [Planctomycetota bacterium]
MMLDLLASPPAGEQMMPAVAANEGVLPAMGHVGERPLPAVSDSVGAIAQSEEASDATRATAMAAEDPEWTTYVVTGRPLSKLFVFGPLGLTNSPLVRHRRLNPADRYLPGSIVSDLDSLIARHKAIILDVNNRMHRAGVATLRRLLASNQLPELSIDLVPPSERDAFVKEALLRQGHAQAMRADGNKTRADAVRNEVQRRAGELLPGAAWIVASNGKTWAATYDQLPDDVKALEDCLAGCRSDFFYAVIAWFLERDLTYIELVMPDIEEFEKLNRVRQLSR